MCGIAVGCGDGWNRRQLEDMVAIQNHRGPDDSGLYIDERHHIGFGHSRLSIIDLSSAGHQPMNSADDSCWIVLNGEIYNYLELRSELRSYPFKSQTDTEVILAAYQRWGTTCLEHLIGMFAFALWDRKKRKLFVARDRFGVKPLYWYDIPYGGVLLASEIKALHAAGVARKPDPITWATYLSSGMYDHGSRTFWCNIQQIPPGGWLEWDLESGYQIGTWYDPADAVKALGPDERADNVVIEETIALLEETIALRFRSDVPVGICLSGGLDSSLLLGLVNRFHGMDSAVNAFTFYCGDPNYDETPWVELMLKDTQHPWHPCLLDAEMIPHLASEVQQFQDEPFGGFPTLGMALVYNHARSKGVTVLLDGNGMDEGWAGYEYYQKSASIDAAKGPVQGTRSPTTRPDSLQPEFAEQSESFQPPTPFGNPLRDLQYRDIRHAKIPRAMRFSDRVSMMFSREVREPFLDHRIVELGLRQPESRKLKEGHGKWLLRQVARNLLPEGVYEAPKRPVQTPQREWLRGPLAGWAQELIEDGLSHWGREWLNEKKVRAAWRSFCEHGSDNSFPIWQWLSIGLMSRASD
ncbi:MAG: asparagine synthase (glutamine-hydrolyzing) [Desulfobacterales bacterium]|nr:asparagine synthase (glutamine-hydrolyzing) [Desulfobacterales bacterium]